MKKTVRVVCAIYILTAGCLLSMHIGEPVKRDADDGTLTLHNQETKLPVYEKGDLVSWYGGVQSKKLGEGRYRFILTNRDDPTEVVQVLVNKVYGGYAYAFFPDESREVLYSTRWGAVVWETSEREQTGRETTGNALVRGSCVSGNTSALSRTPMNCGK